MPLMYLAFIECVLEQERLWEKISFGSGNLNPQPHYDAYHAKTDAEIRLVDIKNDRRYFRFTTNNVDVRIVNNVIIFDNDFVEEIAIDDSKKIPNKKRMDE